MFQKSLDARNCKENKINKTLPQTWQSERAPPTRPCAGSWWSYLLAKASACPGPCFLQWDVGTSWRREARLRLCFLWSEEWLSFRALTSSQELPERGNFDFCMNALNACGLNNGCSSCFSRRHLILF